MALYNTLPVYRDSYRLLREIYTVTGKFSKEFKYSLGQDMKRDVLNLFRSIYNANMKTNRREYLECFLSDFELVKIEMRLCCDLKLLSVGKFAELALLTDNIGKQVTAWRNKSKESAGVSQFTD